MFYTVLADFSFFSLQLFLLNNIFLFIVEEIYLLANILQIIPILTNVPDIPPM